MLCLMLHPLAVDHERRTIDRAVDHLEHAAAVLGPDRVGLGGDFVRRIMEVLPPLPRTPEGLAPPGLDPGSALDGLAGPEDYPALAQALARRGWRDDDVTAIMGGNLLRFLRRALPAA
jgi:membrane dipeptidase